MGTETWIISLPLSDSILYLKIIHPPNFREEPFDLVDTIIPMSWKPFRSAPPKTRTECIYKFASERMDSL